jgi:hypothetical protein
VRSYAQEPRKRELRPIYLPKWVSNFIIVILLILFCIFGDFWPILGNIGPFFMPNLGGKLEDGYQL